MSKALGAKNTSKDIFDVVGSIKAYVYKLPNIKRKEPFMKEESHILLTATTDVLEDWNSQEIEVILNTTDGEQVPAGSSTSVLNKTLKREKQLDVYTIDYKSSLDDDTLYVLSIGEPLDTQRHYAGEQTIYLLSDITPETTFDPIIAGLLNKDHGTTIKAVSMEQTTNQFLNAEVQFNIDPTIGKDVNRIVIDIQKQTLLNAIQVKGLQENGLTDSVKITTPTSLTPILMNCTEDKEKLTMYSPWFNHDFTLPLAFAKLFTQGATLSASVSNKQEREAILDMILLTYAYADQFGFVEYVIEGKDAGRIKGNQYIGYTPKQASQIAGKGATEVISSIYERYLRDYPQSEISREIRILNQHIAALSRWIESNKSVRGGNNSFNKIFLPFDLRIFEQLKPIKKKSTTPPIPGGDPVDTWVLEEANTKFALESLYFALGQGTIVNDKEVDLSEVKQLQADVKYNMPVLGQKISKQQTASRPNEVSEKDVQYLFYAPVDQSNLQDFFGASETIDIGVSKGTEVNVNETAFGEFGKFYENTQKDKIRLFNDLGYTGDFVFGFVEDIFSEVRVGTGVVESSLPPRVPESKSDIAKAIGVEEKSIQIVSSKIIEIRKEEVIVGPNIVELTYYKREYNYKVSHARINNLKYIVKSGTQIQESLLDRKTQFDKYGWKKQIDGFSSDPTNPNTKYSIEVNTEVELKQLTEIDIHSIWSEETTFHIAGKSFTFRNFNKEDETISIERYIIR